MNANCTSGTIRVISATYGENCKPLDAIKWIKAVCEGYATCVFPVSAAELGDPCPGIPKNFIVKYACAPDCNLSYVVPPEANGREARLDCTMVALIVSSLSCA